MEPDKRNIEISTDELIVIHKLLVSTEKQFRRHAEDASHPGVEKLLREQANKLRSIYDKISKLSNEPYEVNIGSSYYEKKYSL